MQTFCTYFYVQKIIRYTQYIFLYYAIYSVPVIDVNALSGISTLNITTYLQDQVHPNSAGGMKIANVVIDALIQYVLMDLTNPYIEDTKM